MMILELLSWTFIIIGSLFAVIGGIGVNRLPDFYSRIHGAGITDTMGAGMILTGLMLQADGWQPAAKLFIILFFLLVTSPTATHALAKSALMNGVKPISSDLKHSSEQPSEKN